MKEWDDHLPNEHLLDLFADKMSIPIGIAADPVKVKTPLGEFYADLIRLSRKSYV